MKRNCVFFISLTVLLILLAFANICVGSISVGLKDLFDILTNRVTEGNAYRIIVDIRIPRILACIILGGALATAGFLLQTFFGNPIAGPYVLGISSGAKLTVAILLIAFLKRGMQVNSVALILSAFAGAMLAMGFVLIVSVKIKKMPILIVCGIMIGYICSAITDLLVTFADDSNIVNLHNWSLGSFSGMSLEKVKVMALIVFLAVMLTFFVSKPMSALQMGESYARSVGVNLTMLRTMLILLSSLLAACVTAFAGPISFVGIAVPHLIRTIAKSSKPLVMIPGCFLGGALVTLFCDGIARTVFAPTDISISTVTAILLVPVVIAMMLKRQEAR